MLPQPVVLAKDLNFKWPAGLIGNPTPFPRCSWHSSFTPSMNVGDDVSACPPETAVGVSRTLVNLLSPAGGAPEGTRYEASYRCSSWNPRSGSLRVSASGSIRPRCSSTRRYVRVADYGITVSVDNIAQTVGFVSSQVTVWGCPGDARHDSARGYGCLTLALGLTTEVVPASPLGEQHPPPFLSLPTSCPRNR